MGNDDIQRPRVDYKARTKKMLDKFLSIAEEMTRQAQEIALSGEDIRSNPNRPGLATLQHSATKAIDEIVRLMPLAGVDSVQPDEGKFFIGVDFVIPSQNEASDHN